MWEHPKAEVTDLGVSPDGKQLAVAVYLDPDNDADISSVLYLLRTDGTVETVDVTRRFTYISDPVFLRSPTDPTAPPTLHWVRSQGDAADEGVARRNPDGTVTEITVALRDGESISHIDGYPGSWNFTATLLREVAGDDPTLFEILVSRDSAYLTGSPRRWSMFATRANTQAGAVAWLSPTEYVVSHLSADYEDYSLVLNHLGCEWHNRGTAVFYDGDDVADTNWDYLTWSIVPLPSDRVFVLTQDDAIALDDAIHSGADLPTVYWQALSTEGLLETTAVQWRPGAWTFVAPDKPLDKDTMVTAPECDAALGTP